MGVRDDDNLSFLRRQESTIWIPGSSPRMTKVSFLQDFEKVTAVHYKCGILTLLLSDHAITKTNIDTAKIFVIMPPIYSSHNIQRSIAPSGVGTPVKYLVTSPASLARLKLTSLLSPLMTYQMNIKPTISLIKLLSNSNAKNRKNEGITTNDRKSAKLSNCTPNSVDNPYLRATLPSIMSNAPAIHANTTAMTN